MSRGDDLFRLYYTIEKAKFGQKPHITVVAKPDTFRRLSAEKQAASDF